MITPAPKYLANRYKYVGILKILDRADKTGKNVAADETIKITKRADILAPRLPLYSFLPSCI